MPAFSKLGAELAALGAPGELIARCRRAAREEVTHTEMCLELAGPWSGESYRIDRFPEVPLARPSRGERSGEHGTREAAAFGVAGCKATDGAGVSVTMGCQDGACACLKGGQTTATFEGDASSAADASQLFLSSCDCK